MVGSTSPLETEDCDEVTVEGFIIDLTPLVSISRKPRKGEIGHQIELLRLTPDEAIAIASDILASAYQIQDDLLILKFFRENGYSPARTHQIMKDFAKFREPSAPLRSSGAEQKEGAN